MSNQNWNEFVQKYGKRTASVIKYLANGWTTQRIARQFKISKASVATYKANLTRGAYYPFVDVDASNRIYFV
jgi:DNA-binding NarL/FixJ family response regulator